MKCLTFLGLILLKCFIWEFFSWDFFWGVAREWAGGVSSAFAAISLLIIVLVLVLELIL